MGGARTDRRSESEDPPIRRAPFEPPAPYSALTPARPEHPSSTRGVLVLLFQRRIVAGLTSGAVKG